MRSCSACPCGPLGGGSRTAVDGRRRAGCAAGCRPGSACGREVAVGLFRERPRLVDEAPCVGAHPAVASPLRGYRVGAMEACGDLAKRQACGACGVEHRHMLAFARRRGRRGLCRSGAVMGKQVVTHAATIDLLMWPEASQARRSRLLEILRVVAKFEEMDPEGLCLSGTNSRKTTRNGRRFPLNGDRRQRSFVSSARERERTHDGEMGERRR